MHSQIRKILTRNITILQFFITPLLLTAYSLIYIKTNTCQMYTWVDDKLGVSQSLFSAIGISLIIGIPLTLLVLHLFPPQWTQQAIAICVIIPSASPLLLSYYYSHSPSWFEVAAHFSIIALSTIPWEKLIISSPKSKYIQKGISELNSKVRSITLFSILLIIVVIIPISIYFRIIFLGLFLFCIIIPPLAIFTIFSDQVPRIAPIVLIAETLCGAGLTANMQYGCSRRIITDISNDPTITLFMYSTIVLLGYIANRVAKRWLSDTSERTGSSPRYP